MKIGAQKAPVSAALDAVCSVGARALAAGALLFLVHAFIESGSITAAEAGVGLGWLAACYWLSGRLPVPHVLVATFLACVAWGLFLESQPLSDWLYFHGYARDLAAGSLRSVFYSKSLTTTLYQGLFHWLLGSSWVTNYIAAAALWTAGAAIVYAALRPFTNDEPRLARFVCVALALCPTFLVFSHVMGSIGMFFLLSAICAWLLSRHVRRAGQTPYRYAVGLGLATCLLFLTRPHGLLLLAVCLSVVALLPAPSRRSGLAAALMLGVFAAIVLGHGGASYANGHGFKVASDPWGWRSLLIGTDVRSSGMHSMEAVEVVPFDIALLPEGKKRARKIAFDRILADAPGFAQFAFTIKMGILYGRDPKLFRRARGDDTPTDAARSDWIKTQVQPVAERVEQGVYRLVFLLFLVLLLRELWRPSPLLGLGGVVLLYSLPHLLLEVDQRYHMLMLPYFVVGAVFVFYDLASTGQRLVGTEVVLRTLNAQLGNRVMKNLIARLKAAKDKATKDIARDAGLPDPGIDAVVAANVDWLRWAQEKSRSHDGGVAAHYDMVADEWSASYPETTGYIVPTLLDHARRNGDADAKRRARRMLDWLASIQLADGGFPGGYVDNVPQVPVVFNTGQILLGLAAGELEFGGYRQPLRRAADWLASVQDADGCWRRHPSPFVAPGEKTYDVHAAWGLLEADRVDPGRGWADAALRNMYWALTRQRSDGFIDQCCLEYPERPLTHTLGYALRGIVEGYRYGGDDDFLAAARLTADGLLRCLDADGYLPGRIEAGWRPAKGVEWACLTGTAQVAACWLVLHDITGQRRYLDAGRSANAFVRRTVRLTGSPGLRGGVAGAWPIDGGYQPNRCINWAAKFCIDANLLEADAGRHDQQIYYAEQHPAF